MVETSSASHRRLSALLERSLPLAALALLAATLACKRGGTGSATGPGAAASEAAGVPAPGDEGTTATTSEAAAPGAAAAPVDPSGEDAPGTAEGAGSAGAPAEGPEDVVERYIHLGAAGGDLAAARELVDPHCLNAGVGRVEAVFLLGARMTVADVETTVLEVDETTAKIEARVSGSIYATDTATTTEILGTEVNVQVGELNVGGMTQTTTLRLKRIDGGWRITCREAG